MRVFIQHDHRTVSYLRDTMPVLAKMVGVNLALASNEEDANIFVMPFEPEQPKGDVEYLVVKHGVAGRRSQHRNVHLIPLGAFTTEFIKFVKAKQQARMAQLKPQPATT